MAELIGGLVIWIMFFGVSMLLQMHRAYLAASRRAFRACVRGIFHMLRLIFAQIGHIIENAARAYPVATAIIAIIIGLLLFVIMSR